MDLPSPFSNFKTLEDFDVEISRVTTYLHDLLAGRNLRIPVSRLPDELLVRIISFAAIKSVYQWWSGQWGDVLDPTKLASFLSVCRRWNVLLSNHSAMWSYINFSKLDLTQAAVLLDRAKYSPLSIEWDNSQARNKPSNGAAILTTILRQFPRIHHLHLYLQRGLEHCSLLETMVPASSSVLESLTIRFNYLPSGSISNRHEALLALVNAAHLRVLCLENPVMLDFTSCRFPRLEDVDLHFNSRQQPPLTDILGFFSRSPLLQKIKLGSSDEHFPDSYSVNHDYIVDLPQLRSFECVADSRASPLLHITRHLRFPPQCTTDISPGNIVGQLRLQADANAHFQSLWPFSSNDPQPKKVSLTDEKSEVVLQLLRLHNDNTADSSVCRTWRFWNDEGHDDDYMSASDLDRLHVSLSALQRSVFASKQIEEVECTLELLPSTWQALFSQSIHVTDLHLRLNAANDFLPFFTPHLSPTSDVLSKNSCLPHLPFHALVNLSIDQGGRWPTSGSWTGVLSGLARALDIRADKRSTLVSFSIDLDSDSCRDGDGSYHPSAGWDDEEVYLDRIRELVPNVEVTDPPDESEWHQSAVLAAVARL